MKHYVCTECKTVSKSPGVCSTADCPQAGAPLVACFCTDGRHAAVLGGSDSEGDIMTPTMPENDDDSAAWKGDDAVEDSTEPERIGGGGKTLDLDQGDDAIVG